ncbi:class I adenylate-forming enzyme family protein [Hazenella coriacea]|uniref:O-succinylbenzoate-CoA ligase n=1 Tax=Hazenella coriacea TaxID=1179467 RepID=A0A4R3LBJ0_9BACL|nr:long-chain-fatty-acid--CoA ligase [Hazenella coriacea]TCS96575.1 O-succinylbenzoate-CoA ligase [Hazenella coriacea]
MTINIGQLLTHRARTYPHQEAAVDAHGRYTFDQLNERVNQLAQWLLDQQVGKGDRVALLCKNSAAMVTIFLAAAKIGAVTIPLNWRLSGEELRYIINDCEPKVIFYDESFSSQVYPLQYIPFIERFVQIGVGQQPAQYLFESVLQEHEGNEPQINAGGNDPIMIIYTSGTTGRAKGVVISHGSLWTGVNGTLSFLDWRAGDRFLSVSPLFHISGVGLVLTGLVRGMTVVYMHDFHPDFVWELIERERISHFMSVPAMLKLMFISPNWLKTNIDSLRFIICGGSAVPPDLIRLYDSYGIPLIQVYGMTEFTGPVSFWTPEMGMDQCQSMGKPVFQTEVLIVDPETNEVLPEGKVGEIVCRGPQTFLGYWKNDEETRKVIRNGWYHTGDLGKIDEDGFLTVIDRYKDMIICGGTNIYPAEVEAIIQNIDGVAEVAVIGVADEIWGEIPRAYVVKRPNSDLTEQDILDYCRTRLAEFKFGNDVQFIDKLPRNSVGKILKHELRKIVIHHPDHEMHDEV